MSKHWKPEPPRPLPVKNESEILIDFSVDPLPYPVELPPVPEPPKLSFYERAKRWLTS